MAIPKNQPGSGKESEKRNYAVKPSYCAKELKHTSTEI